MASLKEKSTSLLVSVAGVNFNNGAKGTLYVVPTGKSCVIHHVVIRNASADLSADSNSFGFNAGADDVITDAVYPLTGATLYAVGNAKAGAIVGTSAQIFGLYCNTTDTAGTVTIDVFGYVF
jgi:hypothetical protein